MESLAKQILATLRRFVKMWLLDSLRFITMLQVLKSPTVPAKAAVLLYLLLMSYTQALLHFLQSSLHLMGLESQLLEEIRLQHYQPCLTILILAKSRMVVVLSCLKYNIWQTLGPLQAHSLVFLVLLVEVVEVFMVLTNPLQFTCLVSSSVKAT